jgi:hypothetical protein
MLYTRPRIPSSIISLFRNAILGKYSPTHPSSRHRAQKSRYSFFSIVASPRQQLTTSVTVITMFDVLCALWLEFWREKMEDPAIIAHMKLEKMSPKGRSSSDPERVRALFKAADQKKMKRYMAPSKKQDVMLRARIFGSRTMARTPPFTSSREVCSVCLDPWFSFCKIH